MKGASRQRVPHTPIDDARTYACPLAARTEASSTFRVPTVLTFSRFALCVLLDPTHRLKVEYESLVKVKAEQESMMAKLTESM